MGRLIAVLFFCLLMPAAALAQKRVALVVGNGSYQKVAKLNNPTRDAAAMADMFRKAGFDTVELKSNLDLPSLRRAVRDFSNAVRGADVAVLFFAGHGIEVNGINYLIPTDAKLERDLDIEDEAVSLDRIVQLMEPAKRLRLVILDACRDNPFAPGIRRTIASRSIGRGLARVDVVIADSMVAFAAKPGTTADDGQGANSPYTSALLKHLPTPGLDIRLAIGRVRDEVLAATANRQEPTAFMSLGGAEIPLVAGSLQPAILNAARAPVEDATASRKLVLTERGLGSFGKDTALDLIAVRQALPGFDVSLKVRHAEGDQYPIITAAKGGKRQFTMEGSDGKVSDIMVFSPDILDANGIRVGTAFRELPRSAIKKCATGAEENSDKIFCESSFFSNLQYWLTSKQLKASGGDAPVKISSIPADARIWAIRWYAPVQGAQ